MYRFFLVCIHLRYPVRRKGGREAYQEEVPPGIKEWDAPHSFNKKAQVCIRHSWALD